MSDWNVSETEDLPIVLLLKMWKSMYFTCFNSFLKLEQVTLFPKMRALNSAGGTKNDKKQTGVNWPIVNCK